MDFKGQDSFSLSTPLETLMTGFPPLRQPGLLAMHCCKFSGMIKHTSLCSKATKTEGMGPQIKKRSNAGKVNRKGQKRQKSRDVEDKEDDGDTFFLEDENAKEQSVSDHEDEEESETAEAKRLRLGTAFLLFLELGKTCENFDIKHGR